MDKKKTYSAAEKKAYYMGFGAAKTGGNVGRIKRLMKDMSPKIKESYKNGFDDGLSDNMKNPKKIKKR